VGTGKSRVGEKTSVQDAPELLDALA
jgi:hypothetical protein